MTKIKALCPMPDCDRPYHAKGFCRNHYRKFFESKQRWQIVKNDPLLLAKTKEAIKRYKQTDGYKQSKKTSDEKYYLKNRATILKYKKNWTESKRFGTKRDNILYKDNYSCTKCGATNDLVVHHKNGQGRCTDNPDNTPKNLITLCRSCHMKVHSPKRLIEI